MAAGLGPVKEGRALLPGDDRRPAMDVTVVTPLQPLLQRQPSHLTWFCTLLCLPEEGAGSCRGLPQEGHCFSASGGGVLGRLAHSR